MTGTEKAASSDWFDRLYEEFEQRHAVMFAFSNNQVAERFAKWELPAPEFPLEEWISLGAGLLVRTDTKDEFVQRMGSDRKAHLETLPPITVAQDGVDYWDRARYRVTASEHPAVKVGMVLVDVTLGAPGTATELHAITSEGEPIAAINARIIHLDE